MYNDRQFRAITQDMAILSSHDSDYKIRGSTGNIYSVHLANESTCTCPDYTKRQIKCKHIYLVEMSVVSNIPDIDYVMINYTDDYCAVCYEEFNENDVDYCKKTCGRRIHKSCFNEYSNRGVRKCIFCRSDWIL